MSASMRSLRRRRTSIYSVLFVTLVPCATVVAQQCSVCQDGAPVPLADKPINVEGIPLDNCGTLDSTAALLTEDSDFCQSIRAIGTLCGCPIPNNACTLCHDGSLVTKPEVELTNYPASDFLFGSPEGVFMSCETMQALLHVESSSESSQCTSLQLELYDTCGCLAPPTKSPSEAAPPTRERGGGVTPTVAAPTPAPQRPPSSFSPCSVCRDGSPITRPDRQLDLGTLPVESCADLELFSSLLDVSSTECSGLQSLGTLCGCPEPENPCTLCPNGEKVPYPNQPLDWFSGFLVDIPEAFSSIGDSLTCEYMEAIALKPPSDIFQSSPALVCLGVQLKSSICGCSPSWHQLWLTWAYRGSGMISMLGSLAIVLDIARKRKFGTTYHQLVLGMSLFDAISSIAYILVAVFYPQSGGFYRARGSDLTCKLQGFMIQLGFTSTFYNFALALYFLLVICFNWKESQFKKYQRRIHVLLTLLGLGLAAGAIPFYGPQFGVCYIIQPPAADSWLPVNLFYTFPVSVVLFTLVTVTFVICWRVYRQQLVSLKWRAKRNVQLTRRVFWQSFWYVMAFLCTLPFVMLSYYFKFETMQHFWVFALVALVAPSQGLMNALIYFQRLGGRPASKKGTAAAGAGGAKMDTVATTASSASTVPAVLKRTASFLRASVFGNNKTSVGVGTLDNEKMTMSVPKQQTILLEPSRASEQQSGQLVVVESPLPFRKPDQESPCLESCFDASSRSMRLQDIENDNSHHHQQQQQQQHEEEEEEENGHDMNQLSDSEVLFSGVEAHWRLVLDESLPTFDTGTPDNDDDNALGRLSTPQSHRSSCISHNSSSNNNNKGRSRRRHSLGWLTDVVVSRLTLYGAGNGDAVDQRAAVSVEEEEEEEAPPRGEEAQREEDSGGMSTPQSVHATSNDPNQDATTEARV